MKRRTLVLTYTLSILFCTVSQAQYYDTGTDPASIRWSQIKTENYRVVFPSDYGREALKVTRLLEEAYNTWENIYTLPRKKSRIDVLIHNYSAESNGYVAWAPKRMELYPMPPQNSIPLDHTRQLINHETIHILQLKALETRFTGFVSGLFGQHITGVVAVQLPNWFYEGDAVLYETLLTPGGRGNNPSFNKMLKALYFEKNDGYSFDKMLHGSYKDYTPDHYRYGFRMMEYSRAVYGTNLWRRAVSQTAGNPFLVNPVNFSLHSASSLTKKKIFTETFTNLSELWSYEIELNAPVEYNSISPDKQGEYINYHSPFEIGNDSLIAIKTALFESPSIVLLTNSGRSETKVLFTGRVYPYYLSYGSGKITWAEISPDPRWENRSYSIIRVHDLGSGVTTRLTDRTRYFAPALSPGGDTIAVVENSPDNTNHLVLIDATTGLVLRKIKPPGNGYPQYPQWSDDGRMITSVILSDRGEGVYTYSIHVDEWIENLPPSSDDIQMAVVRDDTLFYISSAGGTDNLFYKTREESIFQITKSRFGLSSFSLSGNNILASDYDHTGNSIVTIPIAGERINYTEPLSLPSSLLHKIEKPSVSFSGSPGSLQDTIGSDREYFILPYRKHQNLLNPHSWAPFYFDLNEISSDPLAINPGLTILSQNLLSTLTSSVAYEYDRGDHIIHSGITWKGWYPVVDFRVSYGGEPLIETGNNTVEPSVINPALTTNTEISLPLRYSKGAFSRYYRISFNHRYTNRYVYMPADNQFDNGQVFTTGRIFFSNSRRSSYRDIFPPLAQVFDLSYTSTPFDRDLYGPVGSIRTTFYFPGVARNHGLRVRIQAELQKPVYYLHYNRINFPRGYITESNNIISEKLRTLSADYALPILYPDLAVNGLLYFKRLRGSVFFDISEGWNNRYYENSQFKLFTEGRETFLSVGGELLADFNILRIPFDISGGARAGYIPSRSEYFIEAVFSFDIYGFSLGRERDNRYPLL